MYSAIVFVCRLLQIIPTSRQDPTCGAGRFIHCEILDVSDANECTRASGLRARAVPDRPAQPRTPPDKIQFPGRKRRSALVDRSTLRTRGARRLECCRSSPRVIGALTARHLQKLDPK